MRDLDYLNLLSSQFKNIEETSIEIANLSAILTLPKGTEYFFSDLHGEHEAFIHLLRSGSGYIREKVNTFLADEGSDEKKNEKPSLKEKLMKNKAKVKDTKPKDQVKKKERSQL